MVKPEDDQGLDDLAAGRPEAFAALYDRLGPALYRTAAAWLGSRPDAEDAVQEVFAGLVRARQSLRYVADLRAYLFASLRRVAGRIARRRRRLPAASLRVVAEPPVPAARPTDLDLSSRLERALAALPAEQREVIALKIDGGLTFAQIAAVVGISANTAASRYRYALEKLRAAMGDACDESA